MFAVFTVTSLYLCAKARLFTSAGPGHFAKAVLCLLPLGLATFITMSRVAGYKHDFSDVNCGMALGLASGAFAYHLNYPSPFDPSCDEPRTRGGAAARRGKTAALAAEATDTAAAAAPAGESLEEGGGGALHDPLLG
ncbi:phosphoesterase, PA-phosphatase related-family protein [Monoraphidium neglectum]|uniref:Phosphoesterase, PA-phosphatase related-family protein n=1 Tax=Monoraphidium neglectum TaxID=145388 RepID=A0A0D2M529_9CHLO|nr:phosphoesterase, PA-phosphatase related-family protein [Monoraphidium neglectum]KIY98594.1 phosphoesterase, PA-phosphatase related-family protein [Monoraphidium neglectum]|eukprot:XP_013897614.1 phosphoesterase, PA-phosphatase related-family protein [Monoraphidium neglectum]